MRAPVMSVSAGITLARALVAITPWGLSRSVDKAAKTLERVADKAQEVLALRQRAAAEGDESTRVVDGDADTSWAALRMRLEACVLLPREPHARAERARRVVQTLFGEDGLTFLRERYPVQYTVADTILKRIEADDLQPEIDHLAGPEFLANIRAQHERYGDMVQGVLMRARVEDENLHNHMRGLQRAITTYAIAVCATVDDDDPATAERARMVLLPIVNFRQQSPRGRGDGAASNVETAADEPATAGEPPELPEAPGSPGSDEPT